MKVKVQVLLSSLSILKALDTTNMKLSTSYKVRKVLNACQDALSDFDAKRTAIAENFGTLNKEKNQFMFETDEKKAEFQEKLTEILEDEIEMDVKPIPFELLDECINIPPADIALVEWFVEGLE